MCSRGVCREETRINRNLLARAVFPPLKTGRGVKKNNVQSLGSPFFSPIVCSLLFSIRRLHVPQRSLVPDATKL